MGVSENRGRYYSTLNNRIVNFTMDPESQGDEPRNKSPESRGQHPTLNP